MPLTKSQKKTQFDYVLTAFFDQDLVDSDISRAFRKLYGNGHENIENNIITKNMRTLFAIGAILQACVAVKIDQNSAPDFTIIEVA